MSLVDVLTPKDTEEIKPGLFVQKKLGRYRVITPAAWNGKINWKATLLGAQPIKHLFIFTLLMFLVFSFVDGTKSCTEFQADPCPYLANLTNYCNEKQFSQDPLIIFDGGERGDTNNIQNPFK